MWTWTDTATRIMDPGGQDIDFNNIYATRLAEKEDTEPKENELNTQKIGGLKATGVQLFHMPCLKKCNLT